MHQGGCPLLRRAAHAIHTSAPAQPLPSIRTLKEEAPTPVTTPTGQELTLTQKSTPKQKPPKPWHPSTTALILSPLRACLLRKSRLLLCECSLLGEGAGVGLTHAWCGCLRQLGWSCMATWHFSSWISRNAKARDL